MPIHDPNGFEHRLWEAVTGGGRDLAGREAVGVSPHL